MFETVWGFVLFWFGLFPVGLVMLWSVTLHIFECSFLGVVLGTHKMVVIPVAMQKRKLNLKSHSGSS